MPLRDCIPTDTLAQLDRYCQQRVQPGGFLYAVLSGNLYAAVYKADTHNQVAFFQLVKYVEGELPIECRGSPEAVEAWLRG